MTSAIDFKALVDSMGDAIVIADADGKITYWNAAATRIFGHDASDALGQDLLMIVPDRLRGRHNSGYAHSMETGTTRYGTTLLKVPATHKDGRTLSIAFSVSMLFDANQKAVGVAAVIRDETERFREERELRKQLAAKSA